MKKISARYASIITFCLIACSAASCTYTTTAYKNPTYGISTDSLEQHLRNVITFQHINVRGLEIKTNGKSRSELEIEVINPSAVPSTDQGLEALGKKIATQFKLALTDPKEYDKFKVIFERQTSKAGMSATVATSFEYERAEL